jgi:hypothetical protein
LPGDFVVLAAIANIAFLRTYALHRQLTLAAFFFLLLHGAPRGRSLHNFSSFCFTAAPWQAHKIRASGALGFSSHAIFAWTWNLHGVQCPTLCRVFTRRRRCAYIAHGAHFGGSTQRCFLHTRSSFWLFAHNRAGRRSSQIVLFSAQGIGETSVRRLRMLGSEQQHTRTTLNLGLRRIWGAARPGLCPT